jgi:hypothetical protein
MATSDGGTLRSGIVALGLAIAGLFVGLGFQRGRAADRFVTVKGVAEREVKADLAIWPLSVVGGANDLAAANSRVAQSIAGVKDFLARHGIDTTQVELTGFSVNDALANQYGPERQPTNRFIVRQTMIVRSPKPDVVLAASQRVSELAAVGVVISSGGEGGPGGNGPTFVFSGLNKLKPEMIAQATARAREAADQFARDSRSRLGEIRHANQGVFEILPRDQVPGISEETQVAKIVRVVSTVEYFLREQPGQTRFLTGAGEQVGPRTSRSCQRTVIRPTVPRIAVSQWATPTHASHASHTPVACCPHPRAARRLSRASRTGVHHAEGKG